jgi:hypothetical protein
MAMAEKKEETFTLRASFIESLLKLERDKGFSEGVHSATSVRLPDTSYGACHSAVVVKSFKSFLEMRRWLKSYRWRYGGDNPGQLYAQSSELLYIMRGDDNEICAIAIVSNYYDI